MNKLQERLSTSQHLILDGAMGTMLFSMGLEQGDAPELWNEAYPERIQEVHRRYIEAGSQLILTNSFGGSHYRLKLHNLQDRVYELNKAAAEIGRRAADAAAQLVLVAGSMGPTGELLQPMGAMRFAECRAAFAEQARGLCAGGADLLCIETMSHLDEVRAAIEGARLVCSLPIVATLSFDTNGRTMMGVTAVQAITTLRDYKLAAVGANCGANLPDTLAAIAAMRATDPEMPLIAKANAGIPRWGSSGALEYDGTPAVMAGYAFHAHRLGAQLIGACCGSTPETIQAIAAALNGEMAVEQLVMPERVEREISTAVAGPERKHRRPRAAR